VPLLRHTIIADNRYRVPDVFAAVHLGSARFDLLLVALPAS